MIYSQSDSMTQGQPEPTPSSPPAAEIVALSRRQAMDWSLALASQGIEATILRSPERQRWLLLVPPAEHHRAIQTIRLYRAENRGWGWRKELPGADLEIHWGGLAFCFVLIAIHLAQASNLPILRERGINNSIAVLNGEWWRIFTAIFLHSDLSHLISNVTFGSLVLGLSMGRFGAGFVLLATLLSGALGNVMGLAFYDRPYQGLGASGMMMGALGVLAIHSINLWRQSIKAARYIFAGIAAGVLMFVMFGTNAESDVLAHFGGFIGGLIFGGILALAPTKWIRHTFADQTALTLFVTLSALAWILALR